MLVRLITNGKSVNVDLSGCVTVRDIILQISKSENIPEEGISLIKKGKPLKPEDNIKEKEIDDSTTLIGVIRRVPSQSAPATTPSPATPAQPVREERNAFDGIAPRTPDQPRSSFTHPIQPPVPIPRSNPLLHPNQPHIPSSTSTPIATAPLHTPIPVPTPIPGNESDEEYAQRILSGTTYQKELGLCQNRVQLCGLLLDHIKEHDSRLFNYIVENPNVLIEAVVNAKQLSPEEEQQLYRQQQPQQSSQQQPQQQGTRVQLSPDDVQAIRRLMEFGFSEEECITAYLACDRNVDMAANFLFG